MKLKSGLFLAVFLFLLSGCGQGEKENVMPTPVGTQYRTEELFETAGENNEKISLPDAERQEAKEPSGEQEKKEHLEQ